MLAGGKTLGEVYQSLGDHRVDMAALAEAVRRNEVRRSKTPRTAGTGEPSPEGLNHVVDDSLRREAERSYKGWSAIVNARYVQKNIICFVSRPLSSYWNGDVFTLRV